LKEIDIHYSYQLKSRCSARYDGVFRTAGHVRLLSMYKQQTGTYQGSPGGILSGRRSYETVRDFSGIVAYLGTYNMHMDTRVFLSAEYRTMNEVVLVDVSDDPNDKPAEDIQGSRR